MTPPPDPTPGDVPAPDDVGDSHSADAEAPVAPGAGAAQPPDGSAAQVDAPDVADVAPDAGSNEVVADAAKSDLEAEAVGGLTPDEMVAGAEAMRVCGTAARAMEELAIEAESPEAAEVAEATGVLELRDVTASYGPFRALFGLSMVILPGEAVALLGANGAGKTTVARVATGLVAPTGGSVHVDGVDLTGAPAWRFARAGVIHAPEGRSVFATLSVDENLTLSFRQSGGRAGVKPRLERAYELFPVLGKRRSQLAGTMSGGEQRMLSMARVLVESPRLLIADELSLGLAPVVVDEVYASLERLRDAGTALLIVEQHIGHALALCSRVVVEDHGAVQWEGPSSEAASHVVTEVFEAAS